MLEIGYLTIIINLVNSLLPFLFSWVLYKNYTRKHRRFYLLWFIGFVAYGMSNLLNSYNVFYEVSNPVNIYMVFLLSMISFSSIITGIGELINMARVSFLLTLGIPVILVILYLAGAPVNAINLFFMIPYIVITGVLLALKIKYNADLNTPILGFFIILLANIGYATGEMSINVSPIFSILGKSLLFYWMTMPRFSSFAEDFKSFMTGVSTIKIDQYTSWVYMIETDSISGVNSWIKQRVNERLTPDTRSVLVLLDDHITHGALKHSGLIDETELYIIKCTHVHHQLGDIFSTRFMEISNDINELSILISDILEFIEINNTNTQLFFFDLSTLINNNGWKRVYTLLISLIPQLKSKNVQTYFIYTPGTQKNPHETEILRHLGDQIIDLND